MKLEMTEFHHCRDVKRIEWVQKSYIIEKFPTQDLQVQNTRALRAIVVLWH